MARRSTLVARRLSKAIKNDVFTVDGQIASAGVSANQYDSLAALPLTGIAAGTKAFVEDSDRLYISNGTGWYSIALTNASTSITSVLDSDGGTTPFTLATDGSATVITVAATDSDGTPLIYNYSVSSGSLNGSTVTQDSSVFTVTPHASNATTFDLTFTATDGINTATSGANSFTLEFIIDWTTTTQQQKLMISDAAVNDFLGAGTGAISIDDDYIVIGCYVKEAAYIFVRSGSTWTQQQKLTASDGQSGDQFGTSVHISGTSVIVGSTKNQSNGAAYIFTRSGSTWTQQQKLTASDGAANDYFGNSVVIDGDNAIIGAFLDDDGGGGSGSAYVFTRSGSTWTQQGKLIASDDQTSDRFGIAVDINNDYAIVGASFEDAGGNESGAAYIFVRSGSTWTQQQKLTASDGQSGDQFGTSVHISGTSVIVGSTKNQSNGAAYIFTRSGSTWTQQQKLTASDGAANDYFGNSVVIDGDNAIIGAFLDDDGGGGSGSAYVFTRSGSTWTQQGKLIASDDQTSDRFGIAVDINNDYAIVGASFEDAGGNESGAAYIFVRSGSTWTQQQKLTASDAGASYYFGNSVAIDGDTALVASYWNDHDGVDKTGAGYVFTRSGSTWTQQQKLTSTLTGSSRQLGKWAALEGDNIVMGSGKDKIVIYSRSGSTWTQDLITEGDDTAYNDRFSFSVDISGRSIISSAEYEDEAASNAGAVYVFIAS